MQWGAHSKPSHSHPPPQQEPAQEQHQDSPGPQSRPPTSQLELSVMSLRKAPTYAWRGARWWLQRGGEDLAGESERCCACCGAKQRSLSVSILYITSLTNLCIYPKSLYSTTTLSYRLSPLYVLYIPISPNLQAALGPPRSTPQRHLARDCLSALPLRFQRTLFGEKRGQGWLRRAFFEHPSTHRPLVVAAFAARRRPKYQSVCILSFNV
jgi:hypothetical protein